jgi:hypothetical protein
MSTTWAASIFPARPCLRNLVKSAPERLARIPVLPSAVAVADALPSGVGTADKIQNQKSLAKLKSSQRFFVFRQSGSLLAPLFPLERGGPIGLNRTYFHPS